nr:uncharacterized protein LOC123755892 [Procambarus clarkii]XP_045594774.1 uncharacterized protein LOC123755892 [Procambarus clarkii]XP_045594775.1 uncharacterized protein LOC123755892 [Procambarus clarkii]
MSVIIRLQNLPWSANALDIREFFKGLSIPEGGVHIVGGELGDAFIAFSTDEDARLAMQKTGSSLKGIQVTLLLSSRTEMQKVIEAARQQAMALQGYMAPTVIPTQAQPPPVPTVPQLPQAPAPTLQHQQLPGHPPFQAHTQVEAQQQMAPHITSHINSPPNQPNLQQAPPMTMPPSTLPPRTPSQNPSHTPSHIPSPTTSSGPHNSHAANDSQAAVHSNLSANNTERKEEKKSSSTSSSKRDTKGRDSRRRRTKSRSRTRSRSRDRDRRRRHRTRSRSRSRDRSGRSRRRTRSRERDRGRDRNRDRDRDKERNIRVGRDRSDRFSQENNESVSAPLEPPSRDITSSGAEGIPGLGDIPSASMRGPLPSLSEPIKNSPIQTPSPAPTPAYSSAQSFNPVPSYNTAPPPFSSILPFSIGNMSIPPPSIPMSSMSNTFNEPMDTEPADDHPIIVEGPGSYIDSRQMPGKSGIQRNEGMGGLLRGPGDGLPRSDIKGLLGDGPGELPYGGNGRGMSHRNNESFGFLGHSRNRPPPNEPENEYNIDQFDRVRPEPSQRGWDSKEGKDTMSSSKQKEFRDDKESRDRSSFRSEMDTRENRSAREERPPKDLKEAHEGSHDDTERLGGWESRSKRDPHDRGTRWEAVDRRDDTDESSSWSTRGRREGWNGREEENWTGRNSGDKHENWNEKDNWKHDPHNWDEEGYYHRDQDRHGEEHERYSDAYSYRGYRSRVPRGMERGRISRGGRGFNPRFSGYQEESHEDGYSYRGGYRGRGSYRARGGTYNYREGSSEWGEESTCCVEIRNTPVNASYRSVRDLFHGIFVPKTGIKLLVDEQGNRKDVALLQFSQPRDAIRALRFSGNYIFDNKVEVVLISESKYETAMDVNKMKGSKSHPSNRPPGSSEEKQSWTNSTCVCVSGLPVGCTDHDVGQMFNNFKIEDIVLEREKGTRHPSGRCFVRLNTPEEAQQAVESLADASIDGNPITVEICPNDAMIPAVRDRDLIQIQSGSQSGKSQPGQTVPQKNNSKQDEKKVEENKTENQNGDESQTKHLPMGADLLTDSVVMKGVPKEATEPNIRDFFSDEGLVPERVHFCDANSNGSHDVYVMFPLIDDARRAVGKSQQQLCKVKVGVEMIAKPLVMNAMGLTFDPLELIRKGQKSGAPTVAGKSEKSTENVSVDKNQPAQPKEIIESSKEEEQQDTQNESLCDSVSVRDQIKEHPNSIEQRSSNSFSSPGGMIPGPYRGGLIGHFPGGPRGFRPRGEMRGMSRMPPGISGPRGPNDGSFSRMRGSLSLLRDPIDKSIEETMGSAIPPENFGKPGCVVALSNVPYRASTDDILEFFIDFSALRPENIIRRYNEFNQPTADARVAFPTPQEAQRAVQSLNKKYMSSRQVFLALVTE